VGARALLRFGLLGRRRELPAILLVALLAGVLGLATPGATGLLFDSVIPASARGELAQVVAALAAAALGSAVFGLVRGFALLRLATTVNARLEAAIWDRLLRLPTAHPDALRHEPQRSLRGHHPVPQNLRQRHATTPADHRLGPKPNFDEPHPIPASEAPPFQPVWMRSGARQPVQRCACILERVRHHHMPAKPAARHERGGGDPHLQREDAVGSGEARAGRGHCAEVRHCPA
jgi:hypothetical protein